MDGTDRSMERGFIAETNRRAAAISARWISTTRLFFLTCCGLCQKHKPALRDGTIFRSLESTPHLLRENQVIGVGFDLQMIAWQKLSIEDSGCKWIEEQFLDGSL